MKHFNEAVEFSDRKILLDEIKKKGKLKYRDKPTISPYIMSKWTLDNMVEEGILKVKKKRKGGFFFGKDYLIYKLK